MLIPHPLIQTSPTPGSSESARRMKSLRGNVLTEYPGRCHSSISAAPVLLRPGPHLSPVDPCPTRSGLPASSLALSSIYTTRYGIQGPCQGTSIFVPSTPNIPPSNHIKPGMYPRHVLFSPRGPPSLHPSLPAGTTYLLKVHVVGYKWPHVFGAPPHLLLLGWSCDLLKPAGCDGSDMMQLPAYTLAEQSRILKDPCDHSEPAKMI